MKTLVKLTEHQLKLLEDLDESFKIGSHQYSPNDQGWCEKALNERLLLLRLQRLTELAATAELVF